MCVFPTEPCPGIHKKKDQHCMPPDEAVERTWLVHRVPPLTLHVTMAIHFPWQPPSCTHPTLLGMTPLMRMELFTPFQSCARSTPFCPLAPTSAMACSVSRVATLTDMYPTNPCSATYE